MSAKAVFVSIAVLEIYIWFGAFLFYAVEFHDLKNEDTMSHTEVNGTDLLAKLEKLIESMSLTLNHIFTSGHFLIQITKINWTLHSTYFVSHFVYISDKDFYKVEEIFEHLEYVLQNYSIAVKERTLSTTEAIIACHSLAASVVSTIGTFNKRNWQEHVCVKIRWISVSVKNQYQHLYQLGTVPKNLSAPLKNKM